MLEQVEHYFRELQSAICSALEAREPSQRMRRDAWERAEGGGGVTCTLEDAPVFERAGVNFSLVRGEQLPDAATRKRPELAGRNFTATGLSVVLHPRNPHVPTAHCNVRYFEAGDVWWFGGGYDLTPYYPRREDVLHWHRTARSACEPFGEDLYPDLKQRCDHYFYLPHRAEARGVGGLFFDDFNDGGFERCFSFTQSVGNSFSDAYLPIMDRRIDEPWTETQREFQLYRRGRYVEFNLVHDRGTLFGLQSNGRTESILVSMPPLACWRYDWQPVPGSEEARLVDEYLPPRDWLAEEDA